MTSTQGPLEVKLPYGKDDTSGHTASTDSSSDDDISPKDIVKQPFQGRRRSGASMMSGRDMIMDLIAKEMTSTFLEEDEENASTPNPVGSAGVLSAEDLFYAQINGEAIDHVTNTHDIGPLNNNLDRSTESFDFDDDCSFGALTIPDDTRAEGSEKDATSRRSSLESGSKASSRGKSSRGSTSKRSTRSGTSKKSTPSESSHTNSSNDDTLSIEEIQDYVMKNMPPEVRDKIPKEAWAQIFGKSLPGKTRRRRSAKNIKVQKADDDSSIISDITEFTTHPGELADTTNEDRDLKPEEVDWDEEVCPGLDVSRRASETDTKSRSSGSSGGSASRRYRIDATGSIRCQTEEEKTKVSFSYVEVRYYERVLEINPAVTNGPAIGIGWRFKRGGQMEVDDWELQRGGAARRNNELILPRPVREKMLKDAGYDQKQIAEAVRIIRKAKDRRKVTVQNLGSGAEAIEETVEAASRRIMGILTFGAKRGLVKSY